jgi:RNA polymerase sigma factor (sigma-70 family)
MIEQLAKKDTLWRKIAFTICKDKMLADDLVQEMYLKCYDCKKEINDFYIVITIKNIFLDYLRKSKLTTSIENYDFNFKDNKIEFDDKEQEFISELKWYEKELLEMSFDLSLRQIEKEVNIHYKFTERILKKVRAKWEDQKVKD